MSFQRLARIYPMHAGALAPPFTIPNTRTLDDRVGIHRVDPNAERRALKGETARQMQRGSLCGCVGGGVQRRGNAVFRADKNDRAAVLQPHQRKRRTCREKIAFRQYAVVLLPELHGGFFERRRGGYAGIRHQDVQSREFAGAGRECLANLMLVGHVA